MATVRAKFKASSKEEFPNWDIAEPNLSNVKLEPVVRGSPENNQFFKATPSGSLVLGGIRKSAADLLEVGKEYYIDFTPAVNPEATE